MEQSEIAAMLDQCRLPAWESLPDFGLYMDQLITYVERCCKRFGPLSELTSSMINNYVKSGLISRPEGKKYSRDSLAQLLMVSRLKPVASVQMMTELLHPGNGETTEEIYASFLASQDQVCGKYAGLADMRALSMALESSACLLISSALLADQKKDQPDGKQK